MPYHTVSQSKYYYQLAEMCGSWKFGSVSTATSIG